MDGSPRLPNVIARRYLQGRGQLNVGRKPAYASARPLGPLPAAVRTDEPSARTRILQFRPRTCSIPHEVFRSKGSALAGIWEPVSNVRHRHYIYHGHGSALADSGRPSIQATSGRANAGTSLHGTPADVSSGPPSEATLVLFILDIQKSPSVWPRRADYRATRFVAEWPHPLAGTTLPGKAGWRGRQPYSFGKKIWARFSQPKQQTLWYYRSLANTFRKKLPGQLSNELHEIVEVLEAEG